MKKFITIVFAIALTNLSYSQKDKKDVILKDTLVLLSGSYYFTQSLPDSYSLQTLVDEGEASVEIKKDYKLTILYELKGEVYYKYWDFTESKKASKKESQEKTKQELKTETLITTHNNKVFKMPKKEFEQLTKPLYSRYKGASAGAYTVPFRLRGVGGSDFDFESSLSLQANLIFGYGSIYKQESLIDASFGLGITSINLNSDNSDVDEDRSASAFTVSLGAVIKPARFVNFGVFIGWDYLGKNDKEVNWDYNKKTWLGLGINISFNELTTKNPPKDNEQ